MRYLIIITCVAVIAASGVYLAGEYNSYVMRKAAEAAAVEQILARAEANARIQKDLREWSEAHASAEKRTHVEMTDPCFVAVSKLRAIEAATTAKVTPIYTDNPADLRTKIASCVKEGTYTEAQVSDVLD